MEEIPFLGLQNNTSNLELCWLVKDFGNCYYYNTFFCALSMVFVGARLPERLYAGQKICLTSNPNKSFADLVNF